jgi:hypothetical protein
VSERVGDLVVKDVALFDGRLSIEVADGRCEVLEQPPGVTVVDAPGCVTR